MTKPLGYWGCCYDHQLITDVMETFGDGLLNLSHVDQIWLIGKLGDYYWTIHCDDAPSNAAEELSNRLHELPKNQLGCLLQAIANKSMCQSLPYWGCNHELPLIEDIADTWQWNLQDLSEVDYFWSIARLGGYYWLNHCDNAPSEAAQELAGRLDELPQNQLACLIRAIANR